MFETAILADGPGKKRVWTTCAGVTGQMLLVASAMLAPLIWTQVLPQAQLLTTLIAPSAPVSPARPLPAEPVVRPREQVRHAFQFTNVLHLFTKMPAHAQTFDDPPDVGPVGSTIVGAIPIGGGSGPGGNLLRDVIGQVEVPPPAPPRVEPRPVEKAPQRIVLGGQVLLGRLTRRVEPIYPRIAIQARIAGEVRLDAVVGTDGRVRELHVLSGHPMLIQAAVEAVRQWIFQPTLLNGVPVEVSAPVTVTFRLGQ
jgi:periplasmic protein TonB